MADRYWVGGTGTWNTTNTTNWSATNGGGGGASVPTAADNVFFTSSSGGGTCTNSGSNTCLSLNMTGYTGTFAGTGTVTISGNLTLSASGSLTYTGAFAMAGSAVTSTVNTNGKTIPGNLNSNKTNNVVRLDSAVTVSGQVNINSAGLNVNGFTLTASYFQYAGTSLTWGTTPGKIVCSRSTNGLTFSMGLATNSANVATGGRIEILSPPAGITAQVSGNGSSYTDINSLPDVYLINSGTGTVDINGAFRTLDIGAGSYGVSGFPYISRIFTVSPSFTGTNAMGVALNAIDINGIDFNPNGETFGSTLFITTTPTNANGACPIRINQSATFIDANESQWYGGQLSINNNSTLTVFSLRLDPRPTGNNSSLNFPGTSKIVVTRNTTGFALIMSDSYYTRVQAIANNNPIEFTAPPSGVTLTLSICRGRDPTTGETECIGVKILAGGTGTIRFEHTFTGANDPITLKDFVCENGAYTVTRQYFSDFLIGRNFTFGPSITQFIGTFWMIGTGTGIQNLDLGGSGGFSLILNNGSNSPVRLLSNAGSTSSPIGNVYWGDASTGTGGFGFIELQSFALTTSSVGAATVTAGVNIAWGTGKIVFHSNSAFSVTYNWFTPTSLGTFSGTTRVELGAYGTLAEGYNREFAFQGLPTAGKEVAIRIINTGNTGRVLSNHSENTLTLEAGNYTYGIASRTTDLYGSLIVLGTISYQSGFDGFNARGTSTSTITSNGFTIGTRFLLNEASKTTTLADALIANTIDFLQGTFNLNNNSVTVTTTFNTSSGSARTLAFGTGSITLNQNSSFTNATSTNLTITGASRQIFATVGSSGCTITTASSLSDTHALDITTLVVGSGGTVSAGGLVRNLTLNGGTYTFSYNADYYIYGDLTMNGAVTTFSGGATALRFNAASGTQIISTNGNSFGGTGTVNMVTSGVTYQLNSNSTLAGSVSFSNGTLNLNNFRLQIPSFTAPSGTVNFQSSGAIRLTGSGVVWNTSTGGGVIASGTNRFVEPNLNSAQTLTFGTLTEANSFDVSVPTTASNNTLTISAGNSVRNLSFANVAYTVANTALNIYGNLTVLGTTPVFTAGSNTWTFLASSGTQTITSGGETFDFPMTCNVTGTLALGDNVTIGSSRSFTHTAGTVSLGTRTLSTGFYTTSNSNARTISFGTGGQISLTGTGTVWNSTTSTNLTSTGTTKTIAPQLNASQTLNFGALSGANAFDISVPATAGNFTLSTTTSDGVRNLTFANATYTVSFSPITVYGSFTVAGTSPTFTSTASTVTFAATSGSHSITTNGEVLDFPITINAPGATYTAGSALTMGSTRNFQLSAGTFNTGNFSISTGTFSSPPSATRVLTLGSSTWTIQGSGANAWDVTTATGLTLNRGTSKISMNSASNKTFIGGGLTYGILEQAGAGSLTITGSNTFADLQRSVASINTIFMPGGVTTFFDNFTLTGVSAAARTTLSTASGISTISRSSGTVSVDFLSISNSSATGGAAWYAGTGSLQGSNVTGWIFTAPPQASGNMLMVFM